MIDTISTGTASFTRSYIPGESRSETGNDFLEYLKERANQRAVEATTPKANPLLEKEDIRLDILDAFKLPSVALPTFLHSLRPLLEKAVLSRHQVLHANVTASYLGDLASTSLVGAVLRSADLTGALLASANLTGANLTGAILTSANLTGANLTGAILGDLLSASLVGSKEYESETLRKTEALFRTSAHEIFEYGMDSEFTKNLESLLFNHGKAAVHAIAHIILNGQPEPEVAAEALRWLGSVYHRDTHNQRFRVLAASLRDPSHWVRDGAVLGLDALNDKRAIPYLRVAMDQEPDLLLRRNIANTVLRLEQDVQ